MDKRELRLAIKEKLEHRRALMSENIGLKSEVSREKSRNRFLVETLGNPLVNMVLEDCADQIVKSIINEAIKASAVIADETIDSGDYEIGISIPSLHIRHRLYREDVLSMSPRDAIDSPVRRVHYRG